MGECKDNKYMKRGIFSRFYPDAVIESAYDINYDALLADGIRGIIFDIDNTLVPHGAPPDERSIKLLSELTDMGFSLLFLSNNKEPRVKSFRDDSHVNASYIFKAHKPSKEGYEKAMRQMNTDASTTVFIGDQLFTDVWGAKRCGIRNILTRPIHPKEEIQIVLKRILEKIVLKSYYKALSKGKENENSCN